MADEPNFSAETQPTMQQLVDYLVEQLHDPEKVKRWEAAYTNAAAKGSTTAAAAAFSAIDFVLGKLGTILAGVEGHVESIAGPALAALAGHLIGQDVPISEMRRAASSDGNSVMGNAVARLALDALRPPDGDIAPGSDRAQKFLATLGQLIFNGWFESTAFELIVTAIPGMDSFESVAELPHELVDALGLGRLARVALRPLAQIGVATPLEWELNKAHRPTLLSEAQVIRQGFRGKWDWADVLEVLQRKGYSDAAIDGLINEQQKFLSTDDLAALVWLELVPLADAITTLRDQGWDEQTASKHFNTQTIKREDAIRRELATTAIAAYVDRKIDDADLSATLDAAITGAHERELLTTTARGKRALNVKPLSAAQVADCVKVGILGFTDYRDALTREGYSDADGAALELLLRHTVDTKASAAQLKQQQADDRAAAAKAKADAAAQKEADAAARAALARRGSIADNKAAAVRGLIPMARYQDILSAHYDADTVAALLGLAEQARADYLAQQQKRDDAAQRASDRGLNVGQLEQAVKTKVLTLDTFRAMLTAKGLAPSDVDVLAATLQANVDATAAAEKKRADAAAKTVGKHPTLATMEALVRAGHRTMQQYDAFLVALGYDDAGRAAIEDLLQTKIDGDTAAATLRASTAAADKEKGLTLAEAKRGVILGTTSIDDFTSWLTRNHFSADAIAVLVADARDAAATAAAARQSRSGQVSRTGSPRLPITAYAKAARLGLITIDAYRDRLAAAGYAPEEIELDVDELLVEIADTQAKRASGGASAQLVANDIAATLAQAVVLRAALDAGLKARQLTSGELDAAVQSGKLTIDDYIAQAEAVGLDPADAELLAAQLAQRLAGGAPAAMPTSGKATRAKKPKPAGNANSGQ